MNEGTIRTVQASWVKVLPIAPQAAELFYDNLFKLDPSLRGLFRGDMKEQGKKLMQMINAAVSKLSDLDALFPVLRGLGQRHETYGVKPEHYATVGSALLATLAQGLGDEFTPEVRQAWTQVYGTMTNVMLDACEV